MNHGWTWTHKTHHGPDLGEATTFPLIVYFMHGHGTNTQMSFCPRTPKWDLGVSKFSKLGLLQLWRPITLCVNFRLRWGLKQSCNIHWELSNVMWNTTWIQGNQGDSQLLMVESQIANLTFGPSFGHNLCSNYPNGLCEPILDIYVPKSFQWYKKLFNPMGFDLCNCSRKIWEFIGTLIPKWRFNPSHFPTLSQSWEHEMWLSGFTLGSHLRKPLLWLWT
jgi:hypothetical protein